MRIYLAASYERMSEMAEKARELEAVGHVVVSRWVRGVHDACSLRTSAYEDLNDIDKAECLIAFTEPDDTHRSRGGRHVELGYAIGRYVFDDGRTEMERVCIVGPRENVFCHLGCIEQFDTWEDCLASFTPKSKEPVEEQPPADPPLPSWAGSLRRTLDRFKDQFRSDQSRGGPGSPPVAFC